MSPDAGMPDVAGAVDPPTDGAALSLPFAAHPRTRSETMATVALVESDARIDFSMDGGP
ncbi:MAG: hypothetical protein ABIR11_06555 [Candidatus Limnocylindrales bacterium]